MSKRIIESKTEICICDKCEHFHRGYLFGLIPAYCTIEGRIINRYHFIPIFYHKIDELTYAWAIHLIPQWCPVPKEEKEETK